MTKGGCLHGGGEDRDANRHRNACKRPPSRIEDRYTCSYCGAIKEASAFNKIEIE